MQELTRRRFVYSAAAATLAACTPSEPLVPASDSANAANFDRNHFTARMPTQSGVNFQQKIVRQGQKWTDFFSVNDEVGRHFNRQNVALVPGQAVLVPDGTIAMSDINPFPEDRDMGAGYRMLIDHRRYAWVLYHNNVIVRWGSAVCGLDGRTPAGSYQVTETADKDRRSNRYPVISAAERGGALMPYYMRLTSSGIGIHARYVRGRHETMGCIGVFYDDAQWLNLEIARKHQVRVTIV